MPKSILLVLLALAEKEGVRLGSFLPWLSGDHYVPSWTQGARPHWGCGWLLMEGTVLRCGQSKHLIISKSQSTASEPSGELKIQTPGEFCVTRSEIKISNLCFKKGS